MRTIQFLKVTPTEEIKIFRKFKNEKFKQRMIVKALLGKKVNKQFKKIHFRKLGLL